MSADVPSGVAKVAATEQQQEDDKNRLPVLDSVQEYEKLHRIGEGTYGVVYKARHRVSGEVVALKKIRFDSGRDGIPVTCVREMRVLQSCQHPNIVHLKRVVTGSKADSLFLVFEFCEHDMGRLVDHLKSPFSLSEVKCLAKQLLEAVLYLHDHWIIHRDIKMSNLLYNSRGELKLCDFGLARYFAPSPSSMTPHVVTLWYRAPEVLLGSDCYDEAADMWSVGCVVAELLRMEPLFPARSEIELLTMQCNLLGSPSPRIWPGLPKLLSSSQVKLPEQPYNHLRRSFPTLSDHGVDLLNSLLTFDPRKRITAHQALRHPFFTERPYPKAPCDMTTYPSSYRTQSTSQQQQQQQQQPSRRSAGMQRGAAPAAAGAGAAGGLGGSLGGLEGGFGLGNGGLDRRKRPRGSVGSLGYGGCGDGGQGYQGEGEGQGRAFVAACEAEVQRRFRQAFGGGELGGRWRAST